MVKNRNDRDMERMFDGIPDIWRSQCDSAKSMRDYFLTTRATARKTWHAPAKKDKDRMSFSRPPPQQYTQNIRDVGAAVGDAAGKVGGLLVGGASLLAAPFVNRQGPALGSTY